MLDFVDDSVQCAFCHGKLKNFGAGDNPMQEHITHFGNICNFVQDQRDALSCDDVSLIIAN